MAPAPSLKQLRVARGWTKVEAARHLRVSQPYLSLLETGARELTPSLARRLSQALDLSPSCLPLPSSIEVWGPVTEDALAKHLASLGYAPFGYLRTTAGPENPAAVLLWALTAENLEPRLVEALPWLLLHYPDLDAIWLTREAKARDLQNRLGFVVSLATEAADFDALPERHRESLKALRSALESGRLAREDTLCEAAMSANMRRALKRSRSRAAAHWNLLTGWKAEHLHV